MKVEPGYKQTEVGVIPEDWEVRRLGELASVTTGGTPSRTNSKYWNGDIPWITTSEVDSYNIDHAQQSITKEGLDNSAAKLLPPGTLLMALYGQGKTRGKVGVLGIGAATNQACAAISLQRCESRNFVSYFLGSQYEAIRNLSNTGNQENLNSSLVRSIPVLLPPESEQEAIAEALSDADALIESLEQLLAKKHLLKQGAMQELLTGKKRLPGLQRIPGYKQTEVGLVPEDWEMKSLGDVFGFSGGLSASRAQLSDTGHCYLHYGDIHTSSKSYVDVDLQHADLPKLNVRLGDVSKKSTLSDGDVVFVDASEDEEGTSKHQVIRNSRNIPFISGLHTIVAKSKGDDLTDGYKRHCFHTRSIKKQFLFYSVGTKVSGISKTNIGKILLSVPPVAEQEAIAAILSDMDAEIAALEARLAKVRQVKQGMMQELLTGRIRLV